MLSGAQITPTLKLDTVVFENFLATKDNPLTSAGRLMDISYLPHTPAADEIQVPLTTQITINSCTFTNIKSFSNGAVAYINVDNIKMSITQSTFNTISGENTNTYGGVIYAETLGSLVMSQVTASVFTAKSQAGFQGGGRFLYTNQDKVFNLQVISSSFTCQTSGYGTITSSNALFAAGGSYSSGSCLELVGQSQIYSVDITGTSFTNCIGAQQGGALQFSSVSSKVVVKLQNNIFTGNLAVNGGSIYCKFCELDSYTWIKNKFSGDYAQNGGNIYFYNIKNDMTSSAIVFDGHQHLTSTANQQGGSVYYKEDVSTIVKLTLQKVSALATVSEYKALVTTNSHGGAFYIDTIGEVSITVKATTMSDNIAGSAGNSGDGAVFAVVSSGTELADVTIDTCIMNTNKATGGNGGIFSLPITSTNSKISVTSSSFQSNEAKVHGGLFFIGGTGDKQLTLSETSIITTKARTGHGGAVYLTGSKATIKVTAIGTPQATLKDNQALVGDGGLFYASLTGILAGCDVDFNKAKIETSVAGNNGGLIFCSGTGYSKVKLQAVDIKGSTAKKSGGLLYMDLSMGNVDFSVESLSTIASSTASTDSGGLAYIKTNGNVQVSINGPSTTISYSTSKKSGGAFMLLGSGSNQIDLGQVTCQISEASDGEGGFAALYGATNYFSMASQSILDDCTAGVNGGCVMFGGSDSNEIKVDGSASNTPELKNSKVTSMNTAYTRNGGMFYLSGITQTISIKGALIQTSKSDGNGGVIYSEVTTTPPTGVIPSVTITIDSISTDQQFTGMIASGYGSFYYQSGRNSPLITVTMSNTFFKCKNDDFCADTTKYDAAYNDLKILATRVLIGGLFYFEGNVQGTITTNKNTYTQCYPTTEGSVFYLSKLVQLTDNLSKFTGNTGLKGQIYCDRCTATFTDSIFYCNIAETASIMYLDSGFAPDNQVSVQFTTSSIRYGRSILNGGAFYAQGNQPATLKLLSCGLMDLFQTEKDGGFFYIANPNIKLTKNGGSNWNHLKAEGYGGYLEGAQKVDSSFSIPCRLGNITNTFDAKNPPDFASGALDVKGCTITCGTNVITKADHANRITQAVGKFSLYKFVGKVINSTNNIVQNCLAEKGAVFYLENSDITDIGSTFLYNGGVQGGVAYCKNCRMHFKGSKFIGNYAEKGGTFYIQERGLLILEDVTLDQSSSTTQGGLIYGVGPNQTDMATKPADTPAGWIEISIYNTGAQATAVSFGQFDSGDGGGAIYLKNGILNLNNLTILGSSADGSGGFIYSDDQVQVNVRQVTFKDFKSMEGGGFIYSQRSSPTQLIPSYVKFQDNIIFEKMMAKEGGVFYIDNPQMFIEMNTFITITDSQSTGGKGGGVFFFKALDYIDFQQTVNPSIVSIYENFKAPHPGKGSFMYSEAVNALINIESIQLTCQLGVINPPTAANPIPTQLEQSLTGSNVDPLYGGAFFIQDALTVKSKKNAFQKCFQTSTGGIFHLASRVNSGSQATYLSFEESGSTYKDNQAHEGGVIYCDHCKMKFEAGPIGAAGSSVILFEQNYAREGGVIFIQDTSEAIFTNIQFISNLASEKGGVIASYNKDSIVIKGTVTITTSLIQQSQAFNLKPFGHGGVFYLDTGQLSSLTLQNSDIQDAKAKKDGGVFYVQSMNGEIKIQQSRIKDFSVSNDNKGSLLFSGFDLNTKITISLSVITCQTALFDRNAAILALNDPTATKKAGAIYVEKSTSGVFSQDNVFQSCSHMQEGGIFHIVDSKVIDERSQFINIFARYGSVMKCRGCEFLFTQSVMDGNQAESGGVYMIENRASGTSQSVSFVGTKAVTQGGLMSVVQSGQNDPTSTVIKFVDCHKISGNEANEGGVFYINQPYITVHVLRSTIQLSKALQRGGVISTASSEGIIIEASTIKDIQSGFSMLLYSTSTKLWLQIKDSFITCNTGLLQYQVISDLAQPKIPFKSTNTFFLSGNQQTQVETSNTIFSKCGVQEDGGLFRMEGKVNFADKASTFSENSAIEGGVISCSQCNVTLVNSKMKHNRAQRGGVIKLESQANLTVISSTFEENNATEIGGVIFVTTQSVFNVINSMFLSNQGNVSSTIDVLGASSTLINYIVGCTFWKNSALKNTVSLNKARASIEKTVFKDNLSQTRSKNLFVAFAEVNVTNCDFSSPSQKSPETAVQSDETMGAFIFVILDVNIIITNSSFVNGLAKYGGALYISGQSDITLQGCYISTNMARVNGGAIFANGFRSIKLIKNSRLSDNIALLSGDDFFLSNTEDTFEIQDVIISNPNAKNSLYAEQISLKLERVRYQHIQFNSKSEKGAAIQCFGCRSIDIKDSVFRNLRSQSGGAIHLTDIPTNKKLSDMKGKYKITGTTFEKITANLGGALYLDHPQLMEIANSTFININALNKTNQTDLISGGIGGAIYYKCSFDDPNCKLEFQDTNLFKYNFAQIQGGAIHWNYYEPEFSKTTQFIGNRAGWYGDSISSYSQQLKPVSLIEFNRQISRINYPMTLKEFQILVQQLEEQEAKQQQLDKLQQQKNGGASMQRFLEDTDQKLDLDAQAKLENFTASQHRSGGTIPDFQLAHVDKYGQIVADFDSKIRVSVDQEYFDKDPNTKSYTPVLEGTTQYTSYGGVAQVSNLLFSGAPGYKYRLAFLSSGIDESLPVNRVFKRLFSQPSIEFDFFLELRDCMVGEYFTQVGKCIWCDESLGYSLIQMKEPGDCKPCPVDKAQCKGGYNIGPKPGYWRRTNTSSNFMRCPNPDACLGWVDPTWNPIGQCVDGQHGLLCGLCDAGYSLTGLAKCGKCPEMTSNVVKLVGMTILVIVLFVFMVRSTLNGAAQKKNNTSIYMKILMNHFQLVLLVSSFNFQWPAQLEVFFKSTSPVAEASTQVVSIDCFLAEKASFSQSDDSFFKSFFMKLMIFALLPIILGVVSYIFWWIQKCLNKLPFQTQKAIATLVISLFTIHPNIVQTMFNDFNCKDIDGDMRVYTDMTVKCWSKSHAFWSYSVALPSIIVWGLGIPFFALILMYRERHQLEEITTKEKFGFLYNGYQNRFFFWEIVIMYRKIAMIFISVFIQPYGVISQAMIVFMLMIVFLIANLKKKPYKAMALNDLESLSLVTSTMSIYCGIFFISDIPSKDMVGLPSSVKGGINLSEGMKMFLFVVIMVSNLAFFGYWFFKMIQEIRITLITKLEKIYLLVFLCNDKNKLEKIKNQIQIDDENELLREKYFQSVNTLKNVYNEGKLVLTQQILERAQVYLDEDKYFEALGLGRRELSEKEARRFNRLAQGAVVKHNEQEKAKYGETFLKNMDLRRGDGAKINAGDNIEIDEEYVDNQDIKYKTPSSKNKKVVPIRPGSQQNTNDSGSQHSRGILDASGFENQDMYTSQSIANSTQQKFNTMAPMYESEYEADGITPTQGEHTTIADRDYLQNTLKNGKAIQGASMKVNQGLKMNVNLNSKGKQPKHNKQKGPNDTSIDLSQFPDEESKTEDEEDMDDDQQNEIWDELEQEVHHQTQKADQTKPENSSKDNKNQNLSKVKGKKKEDESKIIEKNLDFKKMMREGDFMISTTKQKQKHNTDQQSSMLKRGQNNKKPPAKQSIAAARQASLQKQNSQQLSRQTSINPSKREELDEEEKHKNKIEKELYGDLSEKDDEEDDDSDDDAETVYRKRAHQKQEKSQRDDGDDDIDVFSESEDEK